MRKITALALLALLGCGTVVPPEPPVQIKTVYIPVPQPCPVTVKPAPVYPDTQAALAAATDIFEADKLLMAGRKLKDQRLADLEADLQVCIATPVKPE